MVWDSLGLINVLNCKVIAQKYLDIISDDSIPWSRLCFQLVMISCRMIILLCTLLGALDLGSRSMKIKLRIYPCQPSHQT